MCGSAGTLPRSGTGVTATTLFNFSGCRSRLGTRRAELHSRLAGDAAAAVAGCRRRRAAHADDSGVLGAVRKRLACPEVVWRWLLACQLAPGRQRRRRSCASRDGQVRTADGAWHCSSAAGRAAYSKWLGTAFGHLRHVDGLPASIPRRDGGSARAGATPSAGAVPSPSPSIPHGAAPTIVKYDSRPARVLMADRFTDALLEQPSTTRCCAGCSLGGIDQHTDSRRARRSARLPRPPRDADHHHHPMDRAPPRLAGTVTGFVRVGGDHGAGVS